MVSLKTSVRSRSRAHHDAAGGRVKQGGDPVGGTDGVYETPAWWQPHQADFPAWHAWRGVAGMLYARRPKSSPPQVVRARDVAALRDAILGKERPA